jgi:hypothetical protein
MQAAGDARYQRVAHRDQRPDPADQHRADAQITDLRRPDRKRQVRRARAALERGKQRRIAVEKVTAIDRNRDIPGNAAADEHQRGDIQAHDEPHAQQRRRQIRADVSDPGLPGVGRRLRHARPDLEPRLGELHQPARQRGQPKIFHALARVVTDLQHLGRGRAFGKLQLLLDDQRTAQRHGE